MLCKTPNYQVVFSVEIREKSIQIHLNITIKSTLKEIVCLPKSKGPWREIYFRVRSELEAISGRTRSYLLDHCVFVQSTFLYVWK
jgi:hypothetical protein